MDEVPRWAHNGEPIYQPAEWEHAMKQREQGVTHIKMSDGSVLDVSLDVRGRIIRKVVRTGLAVDASRRIPRSHYDQEYVLVSVELLDDLKAALIAYTDSLPDRAK
jgi:hypothetical protein